MLRKQKSSVSDLKVHLVFTTKYRRKIFTRRSLNLIKCSFENVARKMNFKTIENSKSCVQYSFVILSIVLPSKKYLRFLAEINS